MNSLLTPRRLVATILLLVVVGMIVLGQTVLSGRLSPLGIVVYWSSCLLATLVTIVLSCMDLLRTLDDTRRTQRELLSETLEQLDRDQTEAPRPGAPRESR